MRPAWVAGLAGAGLLALAAPAAAEAPFDLASDLEDRAGVLDDPGAVQAAQDRLQEESGLQLFVVLVEDFDGLSGPDWAAQTADLSGLGDQDLLLAVAVEERSYGTSVSDATRGIDDSEALDVESDRIEPELADEDWDAAAIAAADGYREAAAPGPGIWPWLAGLLGLLGLGWIGTRVAGMVRARESRAQEAKHREELSQEVGAALVELDASLSASEDELAYAEAEFDPAQTQPFRDALETSREESVRAYRLRTEVEETTESEPVGGHERAMTRLREVLELARTADARLDEHATAFAELRDLAATAPERTIALRDAVTEATRRGEETARALSSRADLSATQSAELSALLASVGTTLDTAATELDTAQERVDAGEPEDAVVPLRAAEHAIGRARSTLDRFADVDALLAEAARGLTEARASLEADVADAAALAADDPAVTALASRARDAVVRAQAPDVPALQAAEELGAIERELDAALAGRREERATRVRAASRASATLSRAALHLTRAELAAGDQSTQNRDQHQRLAQGRSLLERARATVDTDPEGAEKAALEATTVLDVLTSELRTAQARRAEAVAEAADDGDGWGWGGGFGGSSSRARRPSSSRRSSSGPSTSGRSSSRRSSSRRSGGSQRSSRRSGGGRF